MVEPVHWTSMDAPLPTMMREEGETEESIPASPTMCVDAPVSRTQLPALGGEGCRVSPVSAWYRAGGIVPDGA